LRTLDHVWKMSDNEEISGKQSFVNMTSKN